MLLDFAFGRVPVSRRHLFVVLVVSWLYMAVNFIVTVRVGPIYPGITWDSPYTFVVAIASQLTLVLI